MEPAPPKTELPPSTQLRKVVFGGSPMARSPLITKPRVGWQILATTLTCLAAVLAPEAEPKPGSPEMPVVYEGPALPDPKAPDGGLMYSPGVQNIQVYRANRKPSALFRTEQGEQPGWTYHHHTDLACWGAFASTTFAAEPTTRFQREQERWRDVRGFNYQPSFGRTAVEIWIDKFDAAAVDRELGLGRKYFPQINTVRLWLSHDPFLKDPALFTRNFEAVLQSCQKHRLRAIPTLFNDWHSIPDFGGVSREMIGYWFSSYGKQGQASNYVFRPFLDAMFKAHAEDSRILAWDLCNEPFNNGGEAYLEWLQHTYQTAKALGARQPIGVSVAASLGQLKPVEPFSDVLMIHPYFASKVPWEPLTAFAREHGKALLATECCWGALDDASRAVTIESDCGALAQQQVGFLAHALHESLVADLHRPQFSPLGVASSASYMAFINMDGSLRPGHDVFNRYCQGISPTGSDAQTEVGRDKGATVPHSASPRILRDDGAYQNGGYWEK